MKQEKSSGENACNNTTKTIGVEHFANSRPKTINSIFKFKHRFDTTDLLPFHSIINCSIALADVYANVSIAQNTTQIDNFCL